MLYQQFQYLDPYDQRNYINIRSQTHMKHIQEVLLDYETRNIMAEIKAYEIRASASNLTLNEIRSISKNIEQLCSQLSMWCSVFNQSNSDDLSD